MKVYVFAQRLEIPSLEDEALAALAMLSGVTQRGISAKATSTAYAEVSPAHGCCHYLVDEGFMNLDPDTSPSSVENYRHQYLGDLLRHRVETFDQERSEMWERFPGNAEIRV